MRDEKYTDVARGERLGGEAAERWDSDRPRALDELLVRVAGGDREAFAQLHGMVDRRLCRFIARIMNDRAQSEEVAQEVYLEVWQKAAGFDPARGRAMSWMLTVAHRRAVDRIRASQSSRNRDMVVGIRDLHSSVDSVSESAEIGLEYRRARRALDRLPALQRQVIELVHELGYSQAQVAARLGVSSSMVRSRLLSGLVELRRELERAS